MSRYIFSLSFWVGSSKFWETFSAFSRASYFSSSILKFLRGIIRTYRSPWAGTEVTSWARCSLDTRRSQSPSPEGIWSAGSSSRTGLVESLGTAGRKCRSERPLSGCEGHAFESRRPGDKTKLELSWVLETGNSCLELFEIGAKFQRTARYFLRHPRRCGERGPCDPYALMLLCTYIKMHYYCHCELPSHRCKMTVQSSGETSRPVYRLFKFQK